MLTVEKSVNLFNQNGWRFFSIMNEYNVNIHQLPFHSVKSEPEQIVRKMNVNKSILLLSRKVINGS